jgi:NADH-quinone oxidoreductase chain G
MGEIKLTIDGREVASSDGKTILDAALDNGIDIPTFCWHPKLVSVGACRICLVEVEGWPKLQVSCATQAADGMVVHVNNERVDKARKGVIEFLLLNHPLDCPTCDKGGECPLQDITYKYGIDKARTHEPRQRFIVDENSTFDDLPIGPEIIRNQNRCIHCYRCTRIVEEICDEDDLGAYSRGHGTEILPPPGRQIRNLYSGNVVENCPVGALTNRDWRYKVRVWLTQQKMTVCNLCPDNCNLTGWTFREGIYRCTSRRNDNVDEGFICDIGRYGYQYVHHPDRLKNPMIKRGGELVDCTWEEAYGAIVKKITSTREKLGPQGIAALVGEENSNEDYYVLGRFIRSVVGSNSLDHRIFRKRKLAYSTDIEAAGIAQAKFSFADLEAFDHFVILGSDLHSEQPITALRLLKAKRCNGAAITLLNPAPTRLARSGEEFVYKVDSELSLVGAIINHILKNSLYNREKTNVDSNRVDALYKLVQDFSPEVVASITGMSADGIKSLAARLADGKKVLFVTGEYVAKHYRRNDILKALAWLSEICGLASSEGYPVLVLGNGPNGRGCKMLGMEPGLLPVERSIVDRETLKSVWKQGVSDREPADTVEILRQISESKIEFAFVVGADPVTVYPDGGFISTTLAKLDFLVVVDLYLTETAKVADVVLPAASAMETAGSFFNWENRLQKSEQVIRPVNKSRPVWRICTDLANLMDAGFAYRSAEEIFDEIAGLLTTQGITFRNLPDQGLRVEAERKPSRLSDLRVNFMSEPNHDSEQEYYLVTGNADHHISRNRTTRTESLTRFEGEPFVGLSERTANQLALSEGDLVRVENSSGKLIGPVRYLDRLRDDVVWLPDNFPEMVVNVLRSREFDIDKVSLVKV